jgi:diaminopimelate decarboxylase
MIPREIHHVIAHELKDTPTPYYLLDAAGIDRSAINHRNAWAAQFRSTFSAYAYKVNPLREVATRIRMRGFGAEVSSGAELDWALSDGFSAEDICFNGPAKTSLELEKAIGSGVRIQVDGEDELKRIIGSTSTNRSTIKLLLRRASGDDHAGYSRLGCSPAEFQRCLTLARAAGLHINGMHLHAGSNYSSTAWMAQALCSAMPQFRDLLRDSDCQLIMNIGGGFPASSCDIAGNTIAIETFAAAVHTILTASDIPLDRVTLWTEPGRSLVEDFGYLITRVVSRKDRGSRHLLTVDSGSNLIRSAKVWHHPIEPSLRRTDVANIHYEVYGHLCFEMDLIAADFVGPKCMDSGDLLIIGSVGGYDLPSANTWGRCRPPIYMLDGCKISEINVVGRMS